MPLCVKFSHIDFWGRPLFRDLRGKHWFYTEKLPNSLEEVAAITADELLYYGTDPDGDPLGVQLVHGKIEIVKPEPEKE